MIHVACENSGSHHSYNLLAYSHYTRLVIRCVCHIQSLLQGKLLSLYHVTLPVSDWRPLPLRVGVCVRSYQRQDLSVTPLLSSTYGANMAVYLLPYTSQPDQVSWYD